MQLLLCYCCLLLGHSIFCCIANRGAVSREPAPVRYGTNLISHSSSHLEGYREDAP